MLGFTYNGKHTDDLKVKYIPDAIERGDFQADFEVNHIERSWFAGGEYFNSRVKTRVFELSCYYELITREEREAIVRWLDRRTSGELIFDDRPYAAYTVRPTKKIEFKDYLQRVNDSDLYSGTFTITFAAYYPYAKLLYKTSDDLDDKYVGETNLLPSRQMPSEISVNNLSINEFLVYNPGTEIGHSIIRFAGNLGSLDLTIRNVTTGDVCIIRRGLDTADNAYYELNSKLGRAEYVEKELGEEFRTLNFAFHDEGYITFAPNEIVKKNISISTTAGSRTVRSLLGEFDESMVGKYIWTIEFGWTYISSVTGDNLLEINKNASNTLVYNTEIASMNRIMITEAGDHVLRSLEIECNAEVR